MARDCPCSHQQTPIFTSRIRATNLPLYYVVAAWWCKILGATNLNNRSDGLRLRRLNVVIGTGTVTGVFFSALWGFRNPEVALCAAAFTALLPDVHGAEWVTATTRLLILLCTWVLALLARCLRDGWTWRLMIVMGVLAGLAFLTKTTSIMLLPIMVLVPFLPQGEDKKILEDKLEHD